MPKQWRIATYDADCVAGLQRAAGIPPLVAQLLLSRGISDPELARDFLTPKLTGLRDPLLLPGAARAAEILYAAIQAGDKITVYGDYDADGMTATAILFRCLRLLHADCDYYVPHRIDEGYSLNNEALEKLASRGTKLVVTVDCGVASVAEAYHARDLGLTLIITDHHQMAAELPPAAAIVHPGLPGTDYPFDGLCGAAVAFKVAWALCQLASNGKKVTERLRTFLLQAVGLAAIGTVADVVPLVDENRILVRSGLGCLLSAPIVGIAALLRSTKLHDKSQLAGDDLGFAIGPRLNAAGRLGQAELAVELLTTENSQRADTIAKYIEELNLQRQTLERSMSRAATKQARDHGDPEQITALVLSAHDWHPGVIGIVAGRLAEKHSCPVIMIANDPLGVNPGIGSARSIPGFNLHEALAQCGHLLESHGGHAAAAGLRVSDGNLEEFRQAFCQIVAEQLSSENRISQILVDAEASLQMLTRQTVEQIESLAPFGQGNSAPMLCASEVRLVAPPKRMGATGRHLSMMLEQYGVKMRAVAFGGADWEVDLATSQGKPISIVFRPVINTFGGRSSVELHLADWRVD